MIFKDLGLMIPKRYSTRAIKQQMRQFVGSPKKATVDIRDPAWYLEDEDDEDWYAGITNVSEWHRDLGGEPDWLLCVWANHKPTEVRYCNSQKRKELEPYHVYAFSNTFLHRTPALTEEDREQRWWARILLPMSANPDLIARLKLGAH